MNRIDFTQQGGFPFTQDATAFMQADYIRSLNALATAWASSQGGPYVILSGCEQSGNTVAAGVVAVNGELVYCIGGSGTSVKIVETSERATFNDANVHPVYFTRVLTFASDGNIAWNNFVRIVQLAKKSEIPTTLPANGGNADTLGGKAAGDFATAAQGAKADSAVQSATVGGNAVTKSGAELQLPAYPASLPANGGNADTVGGFSASQLVKAGDSGWIDITSTSGNIDTNHSKCRKFNNVVYLYCAIAGNSSPYGLVLIGYLPEDFWPDAEFTSTAYIQNTQNNTVANGTLYIRTDGRIHISLTAVAPNPYVFAHFISYPV